MDIPVTKRLAVFLAVFGSIWLSKLFYYGLKYLAIMFVWPGESLVGTPLLIQLLTSAFFSFYLFMMWKENHSAYKSAPKERHEA